MTLEGKAWHNWNRACIKLHIAVAPQRTPPATTVPGDAETGDSARIADRMPFSKKARLVSERPIDAAHHSWDFPSIEFILITLIGLAVRVPLGRSVRVTFHVMEGERKHGIGCA